MEKLLKFTTSALSSVQADIRVNLERPHPLQFKRLFLGLHLDFSTHQLLLYMGVLTLFIELFAPKRTWGGTIDYQKSLFKTGNLELFYCWTNHIPHDYVFNIGMTFYSNYIIIFFWKLQLWIPIKIMENEK